MKINFEHMQAAHCENGVTTNLLSIVGVSKYDRTTWFWYRLRTIFYLYSVS